MSKSGKNGRKKGKAVHILRTKLWKTQKKCHWCSCTLTLNTATIDHEPPLSVGGKWDQAVLACISCNKARGNNPGPPPYVIRFTTEMTLFLLPDYCPVCVTKRRNDTICSRCSYKYTK